METRPGSGVAELHSNRVTPAELKTLFVRSFKEITAELKATVVRLEQAGAIAHGAAELLHSSVAGLPEIDHSAQLLMFFADVLPSFDHSAQQLAYSVAAMPGFGHSAEQLERLIDVAPRLDYSASVLAEHGEALGRVADLLERATGQVDLPGLRKWRASSNRWPTGWRNSMRRPPAPTPGPAAKPCAVDRATRSPSPRKGRGDRAAGRVLAGHDRHGLVRVAAVHQRRRGQTGMHRSESAGELHRPAAV